MAITNNGTVVSVKDSALPTGYTKPTVTEVDADWTQNVTISVAKSGVENATPATAFAAIVSAITSAVDSILSNDFVSSNTVTAHTEFLSISDNQDVDDNTDVAYSTTAESYSCVCRIFVKVA